MNLLMIDPIYLILICNIVATLILFIFVIMLVVSNNKLKKRLNAIMGKNNKDVDLESMILDYIKYVEGVESKYESLVENINNIYYKLEPCMQKIGIVRYNPFKDMGGDLSYTLAILDEKNNGIVLNTLFSRENSRTYLKPVSAGKSTYNLAEEELEAIEKAINYNIKTKDK